MTAPAETPDNNGDPREWIISIVRDFLAGPENTLGNATNDPAWGEPLVGFARGDDPLFESYKEHCGLDHWTPLEAFRLAYPGTDANAAELTVISWVLPQTEKTRQGMRKESKWPTEAWARARLQGEQANRKLRAHMAETLRARGIEAVSPMLLPEWHSHRNSPQFVYSSTWSERHAAYAAGLGTFGLCTGLITSVGKAHRLGSVVARIQVPPTERPYTEHTEYCLFYTEGTCGDCIRRCPAGAITPAGKDKLLCKAYLDRTEPYVKEHYRLDIYGCGFCQVGVPCEAGIPKRRLRKRD